MQPRREEQKDRQPENRGEISEHSVKHRQPRVKPEKAKNEGSTATNAKGGTRTSRINISHWHHFVFLSTNDYLLSIHAQFKGP